MIRTRQATAKQAEKVVDALMEAFDHAKWGWPRPRVMKDSWEDGRTVFVWDDGPLGWTYVFPGGGVLEADVEIPAVTLPKHVWVEPYDGCVVSVYQDVEVK